MASPQVENGYTKIANELIDQFYLINLSPYESRITWYIIRKTYGFGKKIDKISLSQFTRDLHLERRLIHRTIKKLVSKQILGVYRDTSNNISYGIQKDYKKWSVYRDTSVYSDDKPVSKQTPKLVSIETPTKERKKTKERERFEKPSIAEIAEYCNTRENSIDPEAFYSFYESNGWKVGKNPMKSWKYAVITWEKRNQPVKRWDD